MDAYRHFTVASYMYAYYVREATDQQIREGVEKYLRCLPLSKVYVENHRATTDIPIKRLKEVRALLEEYGLKVSGGITRTAPPEYAFEITAGPGRSTYLKILRS